MAFNRVRISQSNKDAGQIKRALKQGIGELEDKWELRRSKDRFRKVGSGRKAKWVVTFERRKRRIKPSKHSAGANPESLESELVRRSIGPSMSNELVAKSSPSWMQTVLEMQDWYLSRGKEYGTGFLVEAIRSNGSYSLPRGFETKAQRAERKRALNSRKETERKSQAFREAEESAKQKSRQERFQRFWEGLSNDEQDEFQRAALAKTCRTKLELHANAMRDRSPTEEILLLTILMEHFIRLDV